MTVVDPVSPTAVCNDITVVLDASGQATIVAADIDGGSNDNCGSVTVSIDPNEGTFDCSNVGVNTVTLVVTDLSGNTDSCVANVTVVDPVAPTAVCKDITVVLDVNGQATIVAADIDGGSTDNCGSVTISIDPNDGTFDCSDAGVNGVALIVTDQSGNSDTCIANVTVVDGEPPVAICQDVTIQLDQNGNAMIFTADINNGSLDNCGIANVSLDKTTFDCSEVGPNTVTLTVTDVSGNADTCQATVTVQDNIPPVANCEDITVYLDQAGIALVNANDIDGGSTDNCGVASVSTNVFGFGCGNIGDNPAILTVTDVNGNVDTCTAIVTVLDTIAPTVTCQDITITLDANGQASIDVPDVLNNTQDNCGAVICTFDTNAVSQTDFDCGDIGTVTVTLIATDVNGNIDSCEASVTIVDSVAPTAVCQDVTVQVGGNGTVTISPSDVDGGTTDNCDVDFTVSDTTFDCSELGPNPVVLTATDPAGNSDQCTATVTVEDVTPPTAVCQDITVQIGPNGVVSIDASDVDGGSTDNCSVASISIDQNAFGCPQVGPNTVTLTVVDGSGNTSTCTATVTVEENIQPVAVCNDITVQLDANGQVSITAADVDGGSADVCGIATIEANPTDFDCSDIGNNNVTLVVTDVSGNQDSCVAIVTVEDNIPPVANCQDITVYLNQSGFVLVNASDLDGGSTDNCGVAGISTNVFAYGCGNIGDNPAILTVTDVNGNVDTCTSIITVLDTIAPTVTCQDVTISLDANGQASIDVPDVLSSTSDNCGSVVCTFDTNAVSQTDFDCGDIGTTTVTLIARDVNGNIDSCQASVTIEDNIDPSAVCQDITVQVDNNGNVSITPADVDGGSSDNCDVDLAISDSLFDCSDIGPNGVILTATDPAGNSDQCTATVTVEDVTPPVAVCQDITLYLNNGTASISVSDVDGGSTDNCQVSVSISDSVFDCASLGVNPVTITAVDPSGNTDDCIANVTVLDTNIATATCQDITVSVDPNGSITIDPSLIASVSSDACGVDSVDVCGSSCSIIDFNSFSAGTNITTQLASVGISSVSATGGINQAWIFDSSNPTGGDWDLGTPNQQYGGPGVGNGGASNNVALGKLLIVQENNNTPDDNGGGGNLYFNFSNAPTINSVKIVDIEENNSFMVVTQTNGNTTTIPIAQIGDNSVQDVPVNLTDVAQLRVRFKRSGGVASLDVCNTACNNTFTCADVGTTQPVVLTVFSNGNQSSCTANVTIVDSVPPVAVCQDVTLQLNSSGHAAISAADVDGGSTDNCNVQVSISESQFDCSDVGTVGVTLTATDNSGNADNCLANVTVEDNVAPDAVCQDVTVYLDGSGQATITATDVDGGSTDNCSIDSIAVDEEQFDCADLGANAVTLTVSDPSGNTDDCQATVTVVDTVAPTAICQNITVSVDSITGTVTVTGVDIDAGSLDNCGIDTVDICGNVCSIVDFNSFSAGTNITTQLASQGISSISATGGIGQAWIFDSSNPTGGDWDLGTPNQQYGGPGVGNGGASNSVSLGKVLIVQENNNTPDDNGGGGNLYFNFSNAPTINSVKIVDIEENNSFLDVTNTSGITTRINIPQVGDNSVQDVPVNITDVAQLRVRFKRSGAIASLDLCNTSCTNTFACGDSAQTVTLTVTDNSGNQSTCTANVTVEGGAPSITCPPNTVSNCIAEIPVQDPTSVIISDGCGGLGGTILVSDSAVGAASCANGVYTLIREYTLITTGGVSTSCQQTITVDIDTLTEGTCQGCDAEISIVEDCLNPGCFFVTSCKDLSNVVLRDENGNDFKFDNLNQGGTGYFCHPSGLPVTDVWVKSGCFKSGDGPGYGHHFEICAPSSGNAKLAGTEPQSGEIKVGVLELDAYPNPTTGYLKVELMDRNELLNGEFEVKLVDVTGRVLERKVFEMIDSRAIGDFDLSGYASGFYYITVEGPEERLTQKVMRK